jgi:hypothetical protein
MVYFPESYNLLLSWVHCGEKSRMKESVIIYRHIRPHLEDLSTGNLSNTGYKTIMKQVHITSH